MSRIGTSRTIEAFNPLPRILVAGLGNILLRDDGVGVHAVAELSKAKLPGVVIAKVGTAVLDALHLFEWADKILAVDAMQAGGRPGSIYLLHGDSTEEQWPQNSLHELSLLSALRFIPRELFPELTILGIEPEAIEFGLELTPSLQAALPDTVLEAQKLINEWRCNGFNRHSRKEVLSKKTAGGRPSCSNK